MAIPTVVGVGTLAASASAITPGLPSGLVPGDWMYLNISTANQSITIPGGGWDQVSVSPQSTGAANTAGGLRQTLFRRIYQSGDTAPTTSDSGSYQIGRIIAFRGVDNENDISASVFTATGSGDASWPAVTTTVDDCLIVGFFAGDRDILTTDTQTASLSTPSFDGAANTKAYDDFTNTGQGGGVSCVYGSKASAGTINDSLYRISANNWVNTVIVIALAPQAGGGGSSVISDNTSHTHSASQPTVAAKSSVSSNSSAHGHSATSPGITAKSSVSPAGGLHAQAATSPSLSPKSALAPGDSQHDHQSANPSLAAANTVSPANSIHGNTPGSPSLASKASLVPDDATHDHTATAASLSGALAVTVASAVHVHAATEPDLGAHSSIAANDNTHGQSATAPSIGTGSAILPASSVLEQIASSPTLAVLSSISPNSALHQHSAVTPAIRITMPPSAVRTADDPRPPRTVTSAVPNRSASTPTHPRTAQTAVTSRSAASVRFAR